MITDAFPDHAILGEEGGVSGNTSSDYLWCVCSESISVAGSGAGVLLCILTVSTSAVFMPKTKIYMKRTCGVT